jgi:ATP-binding cassette subfamily B protein
MERGSTLSLGQRQLISFVRALLYDPSILILDEATSSVDTESEMLIQRAIDKLISDRTSIVIAHRLSTISKASKIIVLDKGEIREMGTHEELLKLEGFYYKLHSMQFKQTGVNMS